MRTPTSRHAAKHVAAFYATDRFIVTQAADFIASGLRAGERVIALATQEHWNAIMKELERSDTALGRATADGRLVLIEADRIVEDLVVAGPVDVGAFRAMLQPLIVPGAAIRVYGEVVSLLAARGDVEGALAIERLGHELSGAHGVNVLCGYHVAGARPLRAPEIARIRNVHHRSFVEDYGAADRPAAPAAGRHFHAVQFYPDRHALARIVSEFLDEGFSAGEPAIVIATPEHRDAIEAALRMRDVDVTDRRRSNDLIVADAAQTLSQFMVGGTPDAASFEAAIVPLIERTGRRRAGAAVRVYGEIVDVLWKDGRTNAAIKLEMLWNGLAQSHQFALLCGYAMGHFYKAAAPRDLHDLHTHVWSHDAQVG